MDKYKGLVGARSAAAAERAGRFVMLGTAEDHHSFRFARTYSAFAPEAFTVRARPRQGAAAKRGPRHRAREPRRSAAARFTGLEVCNGRFQILLLSSNAMYSTGALALSSLVGVAGFSFWPSSLTLEKATRGQPTRPCTGSFRLLMKSTESMRHPLGTRARVLLTSVFGPFATDDEFGSRIINPIELYHNQVTREQGPFSLRMFHRSWGILLIQHNISAPCTVLDFPTCERFIREIAAQHYDVIGISSIVVNVGKVREMCRLIRAHSPHSLIVVGGHVTAIPDIERRIDADHIVRGEGVRWFREFLGEPADRPLLHPAVHSSFGFRLMGLRAPRGGGDPAATIITSVGCPMGCNFCTTSAFFGGKGKVVNFYERGAELFQVMSQVEARLGVSTFFMMDENFLLYRKRALELLECMKAHGKAWSLYVFSSANALAKYDIRQLVELGISWVWLGLESKQTSYAKLRGADTLALTKTLQQHGIRVHGSTIVGLEHHTPENLVGEIEHAVAHSADCHQFMLYTPMPGTPLYREIAAEGRLLPEVDLADIHGQYKFNFRHPAISRDESKSLLDWAFRLDFERNGPSLYRLMRTMLEGWRRYHGDRDPRVRARMAAEGRRLRTGYGAALWAMERYLRASNRQVSERIRELRLQIEHELGGLSRIVDRLVGPVLLWSARREARRFPRGRPLEPRIFVERRNWADARNLAAQGSGLKV